MSEVKMVSCPGCNGTGDQGGNPAYGACDDCNGYGKIIATSPQPVQDMHELPEVVAWRERFAHYGWASNMVCGIPSGEDMKRDYHFGTDIPAPSMEEAEMARSKIGADDMGKPALVAAFVAGVASVFLVAAIVTIIWSFA